jgi:hypothetical protein
VLLALAPGCLSLNGGRPLPVQVVDAETKQPIAGAGVQIVYPFTSPALASGGASGPTGRDGIARLWAVPSDNAGVTVEVAALGHLTADEKSLSAETVRALEPIHLFEAVDRRPAVVVIELYAEPRPTIELVVPVGYRGIVKAEVQVQEDIANAPGQRLFSYEVPPDGVVPVIGPALLRHVFAPDFRARYADGTPLSRNAKGADMGFWWLKSEGPVQVFLVGTSREFDDLRRDEDKSNPLPQRSAGGRGEGRGDGGRRGGRRGGGGAGMSMSGPG